MSEKIPLSDFVLLGGDFNTDGRSESCIGEFKKRFVTDGPHPADQQGNSNTNQSRSKPYDWVLASPCLRAEQRAVTTSTQSFPAGLVFDTTTFAPLSEFSPSQYSDSNASNMQHMAVIKDFLIAP
jgi:hypothetical protein